MNVEQIAQEVADELVKNWQQAGKMPPLAWDFRGFATDGIRRCLSKLAEQDMEPVAWQDTQTGMIYTTVSPAAKHLYSPIYTETQLLAAQQRTAEACAKLCDRREAIEKQKAVARLSQKDIARAQMYEQNSWQAMLMAQDIRNGYWR